MKFFRLLSLFVFVSAHAEPVVFCDAANGLTLINKQYSSPAQIQMILDSCDKVTPNKPDVLLLHALFARKNNQYEQSIQWLLKARTAAPQDLSLTMELAAGYEITKQWQQALELYQYVLSKDAYNRAALLSEARILRLEKQFVPAAKIYQSFLEHDPKDADALNGMGWISTTQNDLIKAKEYFNQTLAIQPENAEALAALKQINLTQSQMKVDDNFFNVHFDPTKVSKMLCDANTGFRLLDSTPPPVEKIQEILRRCDRNVPNLTASLLLHGLLERYLALQSGDYQSAILWLEKAIASTDSIAPVIELAVTYEWAGNFKAALAVYRSILAKNPNNLDALIGEARVLRFSYQIQPALQIYHHVLASSPGNIQALSGLGETYMVNYDFDKARQVFHQVLRADPKNQQVQADLQGLDRATKNLLDFTVGGYDVPPRQANGFNLNYFRNLNATDGLNILAVHNTRQIESNFGAGPTLLPNNSLLVGYQRLLPGKYGWQLGYDARQHDNLPFENRVYGGGNLFLQKNLEWFGGLRLIFPSIWNTQLFSSGLTAYTSLPVNITVTGFWAFQQIGGYNSSYALDFSKEYSSRLFYDIGPSYLIQQDSWEVHGRLIFPMFKNQALLVQGSHYFFNSSTFITAGWRIYWA